MKQWGGRPQVAAEREPNEAYHFDPSSPRWQRTAGPSAPAPPGPASAPPPPQRSMSGGSSFRRWSASSPDDARKVIKRSSTAFLMLALLQVGLGALISLDDAFVGVGTIAIGVVFAVLAVLLRALNSRAVAVVLLVVVSYTAVVTAVNLFGGGSGGQNVVLAVIMVVVAVQAVVATFRYQAQPAGMLGGA